MNLDFVADDESPVVERLVPDHIEVFPIQRAIGGEPCARVPPGVFCGAIKCPGQRHFFGHTTQSEVADHRIGVSLFLVTLHLIGHGRELLHIEEVGVAQMGVALFLVGINRGRLNRGFDRFKGFGVCVHDDEAFIVHESSRCFGYDHVTHTKLDDRVIGIDIPPGHFRLDAQGGQREQAYADQPDRVGPGSAQHG